MSEKEKANRPLPPEPAEDDYYDYSGFEKHEFSDVEEQVDYTNNDFEDTIEEDYSEEDDVEPAAANTPNPALADETYDEVTQQEDQEMYEAVNENISRPPLPAAMQPQDEYLVPGEDVGEDGKEYSQVLRNKETEQICTTRENRPAPSPPVLQRLHGSKKSLSSRPLPNVPIARSKDLSSYSWYFGDLDRLKAISMIKDLHCDGAYLVRNSTRDPKNPYALSILYKSKVWNLHIHVRPDKTFAIGALKPDEQCFDSIMDLIEFHKVNNIILIGQDGGETLLTKHPKK